MRKLLLLLIFVLLNRTLFSLESLPLTNYEIFKNYTIQYLKHFENSISTIQMDSVINFNITNSSYSPYFEALMVGELSHRGWKFKNIDAYNSNSNTLSFIFSVFTFDIKYENFIKNEKIKREIKYEARCIVRNLNSTIQLISKEFIFSDTISVDLINYIEKDGNPFTSPLPKGEPSFVEKYIEPIAVIGASAFIIFLFFTIRSH